MTLYPVSRALVWHQIQGLPGDGLGWIWTSIRGITPPNLRPPISLIPLSPVHGMGPAEVRGNNHPSFYKRHWSQRISKGPVLTSVMSRYP